MAPRRRAAARKAQRKSQRTQEVRARRDAYTAGRDQYIVNIASNSPEPVVPGLLPRDTPGFTGRADELARITSLAREGAVVVCAIDGSAGVGKTALAVHAAHMMLDEFPDGQLFADLHGHSEAQVAAEPGEVLEMFLRRLGIPAEDVPMELEDRAGLLRQLLTSRRVLMVLDNAASEAQLRPLLPGGGSSVVLITSRATLTGLELDERLNLDVLPREDATVLLAQLVGQQRAVAEPEALVQVRDYCGCLPLALRIAGQLLAAHPSRPVAHLAEMLADARHRLDRLAAGDRQVRAAFMVSYEQLAAEDARLFRLASLDPGPDFTPLSAARAAGMEPDAASLILDRLTLVHLVTEGPFRRFGMHDLLRLFALEACEAEDGSEARRAAQGRIVDHYAGVAEFANSFINPDFRSATEAFAAQAGAGLLTPRQALVVLESERQNLLAAVRLAAELNEPSIVSRLSQSMADGFRILWHFDDLLAVSNTALKIARLDADRTAEAWALTELGIVNRNLLHRFEEAIAYYEQALTIRRETGDRRGEAYCLMNLGVTYAGLRRFEDAITCDEQALAIFKEIGDRRGEGLDLGNLATVYMEVQRFEDAVAAQLDAVKILRKAGDRRGEASALLNLGNAYQGLHRFKDAVTVWKQGLAIFREIGDRHGEGVALAALGKGYQEQERYRDAIVPWQRALAIFQATGDRHMENQTIAALHGAYVKLGRYTDARYLLEKTLGNSPGTGDRDSDRPG